MTVTVLAAGMIGAVACGLVTNMLYQRRVRVLLATIGQVAEIMDDTAAYFEAPPIADHERAMAQQLRKRAVILRQGHAPPR